MDKKEQTEHGLQILEDVRTHGHRHAFEKEYGLEGVEYTLDILQKYSYFVSSVMIVDVTKFVTYIMQSQNAECTVFHAEANFILVNINQMNELAETFCNNDDIDRENAVRSRTEYIEKAIKISEMLMSIFMVFAANDFETEYDDAVLLDIKELQLAIQSMMEKGDVNESEGV